MSLKTPIAGLPAGEFEIIEQVLMAALDAVDPRLAVEHKLSFRDNKLSIGKAEIDLKTVRRVRLAGVGKASIAMARGALDALGDRILDGLVISKHGGDNQNPLPERIITRQGGHPVPSEASVDAAAALAKFLEGSREDDLVICLISGGGSALMTLPVENVSLEDLQQLTRLLLACGADIGEMNTLRKHLDRVKGGGLARLAAPAQMATLVLSDVIGSPLDVIASGPTVADPSTYAQCMQILQKYSLVDQVPSSILAVVNQGLAGALPETMKPGDARLSRVITEVIAANQQAAAAGLAQAKKLGLNTLLLSTYLQGEASQAGLFLGGILKQIHESGEPLVRPACIAAGGETTVTIKGSGLGGRNQELALGAANLLAGIPNVALVTLGTDGEDGPTTSAGAVVTGRTIERAKILKADANVYLKNNDSHRFFSILNDLVNTGPTGTNVNDLVFLFAF